ncbi:hypothetical protein CRUP_002010, partial [Coryphaenoides rupestris]
MKKGNTIQNFLQRALEVLAQRLQRASGPLFSFDVHDDIRLVNDARVEKDESHAGKVVLRSWYEKNKHICPASSAWGAATTAEKKHCANSRIALRFLTRGPMLLCAAGGVTNEVPPAACHGNGRLCLHKKPRQERGIGKACSACD